jgi:hypothetical protein
MSVSTRGLVIFVLLTGLGARAGETWVLVHARVLSSASAAPIEDGTVVVRDGRIAALGLFTR